MLYHSFQRKPRLDADFCEKRLVFRDLEANNEAFNQANERANEDREVGELENIVETINNLDLSGENNDPIELPRNKNIYEVLVQALAENQTENAAGIAAEIADGLSEHSNFGLEKALSPWRHFDSFKIEHGELRLYRENRRGEIQSSSNIDLRDTRSTFMLNALEERDAEVAEQVAATGTELSGVVTDIATEADANSPSEPQEDRIRGPRAMHQERQQRREAEGRPRRTFTRRLEDNTPVTRRGPRTIVEGEEGLSEEEIMRENLITALENIDTYTEFHLQPELQRSYTLNQFRSMGQMGRLSGYDVLMRDLDELRISFDELGDTLHFRDRRGSARNLEAGANINAGDFLQNTSFANESFEQFVRTTLILEQNQNRTPEEEAELQSRRDIFTLVNRVVETLENMEASEEVEYINTDYIRRIRINRDVDAQLRDALGNRTFEAQEKELVAIVTLLYGPLEELVRRETFSIDRRGDNNQRSNMYVLTWNSLDGIDMERVVRLFDEMKAQQEVEGGIRTLTGRNRTLTDAIGDIQEMDGYQIIRDDRFENPDFNMEGLSEDEQAALRHLNYMFDRNNSGPRFHRGRRRLEQVDTMGGAYRRNAGAEGIAEKLSERQMYSYLSSRILVNGDFSLQRLAGEINRLSEDGRRRMTLDPNLDTETKERLATLDVNFTAESLRNGEAISEDIITLVEYGILEASDNERIMAAPEVIDTQAQMQAGIVEQFRGMGIPDDEADRLARESMGILGSFDANEILTERRIGVGANIRIRLGARRDENGTYQLITGENGEFDIQPPFEENGRTVLTVGVGSSLDIERIGSRPDDVGIEIGINTRVSGRTHVGTSISVRPFSGASIGAQGGVEIGDRNWELNLGAGVGTTFLGIPYGHARIGVGQGIEQRLDNAIDRAGENMNLNRIEPDVWRAIDDGRLNQNEILEIARTVPEIVSAVENGELPADKHEEAMVYYLETIARELNNAGVEDTRGVGFEFGVMLIVSPAGPIPVPFINIEFVSRRVRYAYVDQSTFDTWGMSAEEALADINAQISQGGNTEEQVINLAGTESRLDPLTGRYTLTQPVAELESIRFEDASDFVRIMNERSTEKGMEFSNVDPSTGFTFAFSLRDYARAYHLEGISRTTDILVDPATGFEIQQISPNLYGIRFGSNPEALPPEGLNIIRQDVYQSHGSRNNINTVFSFSVGNHAATGEQLLMDPRTEETIRINERGEHQTIDLRGDRHAQIEWLERTGRTLEVTIEDLESRASNSAELLNFISRLDSSVTSDPERVQQLTDFYNEISDDRDFLRELAQATTIDVNTNGRPDYNRVRELLEAKWIEIHGEDNMPEFTQADLLDLESRLIPDTFIRLENISERRRVEEVQRVVRELTFEYTRELLTDDRYNLNYIENGERVNFTEEQKTTIMVMIANVATQKAEEIADAITNCRGEELSIDTVDGVLTTAGMRQMGARGFRQHIFGEGSMPRIIEGSQTSFFESETMTAEEQVLVAQFVSNLYEPAIDFTGDFENEMDNVRELFRSPSALELIGMQFKIENIDQAASLVSLMFSPEQFARFTELYTQISNGENPALSAEDQEILNHFLNTVQDIRETRESSVEIKNMEGELISTLEVNSDAGFMFIEDCGNLTFYYDRDFSGSISHVFGFDVRVSEGDAIQQRGELVTARTMRVGASAPVRGRLRDRGKEDRDDIPPEIPEVPEETPDDGKEDIDDAPAAI